MDDKLGKELAKKYYNQEAEGYINQYRDRYNKYPANLIRINMILKRIKNSNIKTILDIGCGTCGPMIKLLKEGFDVYGIDSSQDMIDIGKEELKKAGFHPDRIWLVDIEDETSINYTSKYDAVIALGVFPHVLDEHKALLGIRKLLNVGGRTFIEFRNALFASFTFNKYSPDLYLNKIIEADSLPESFEADVKYFFHSKFQSDEEEKKDNKLSYNDILAKFNNPLSIDKDLYSPCGFSIEHTLFYHYHAVPPSFRNKDSKLFDELSMKIEDPYDWRGNFMASAFVVEAVVK